MTELMSNPLFIPLIAVTIIAIVAIFVLVIQTLGYKDALRLMHQSFPADHVLRQTNALYERMINDDKKTNDLIAYIVKFAGAAYESTAPDVETDPVKQFGVFPKQLPQKPDYQDAA